MQMRLAKADTDLFNQFADRATLLFVERSKLLKQFRIDLNL